MTTKDKVYAFLAPLIPANSEVRFLDHGWSQDLIVISDKRPRKFETPSKSFTWLIRPIDDDFFTLHCPCWACITDKSRLNDLKFNLWDKIPIKIHIDWLLNHEQEPWPG